MCDCLLHAQTVIDSSAVSVAHSSSSYVLGLAVYNVAPSSWETDDLLFQVSEVNRVMRQCDVQVDQVELITLDEADQAYDFQDFVTLCRVLKTQRYMSNRVANLFFVDSFTGELRKQTATGVALNDTWVSQAAPWYQGLDLARGSAWLSRVILTPRYRALLNPRYSPATHELAHLLLDAPHISDPSVANVLSGNNLRNDVFTDAQCAKIRRNPLVHLRGAGVQSRK